MGKAEAYAGYLPDVGADVTGFSMMHESGIGGAPKYGVVSQFPVPGSVQNPLVVLSAKRTKPDEGSVGYYKSSLDSGITVELAATNHAGFYQYTFPKGDQSSVVVDVSHVLQSFRGMNWGQIYRGGAFAIAQDGHYEGSGTFNKGWNLGKSPFLPSSFFSLIQFNLWPMAGQTWFRRSPEPRPSVFYLGEHPSTDPPCRSHQCPASCCISLHL
jgi:hypothetical protein